MLRPVSHDNQGARALRRIDMSQAEKAAAVGTVQCVISRWESGERKPSAAYRITCRDALGIEFALWDRPVRSRKRAA